MYAILEIELCREVHSIGIVRVSFVVDTPSVQIFNAQLQIVGEVVADVGGYILPALVVVGVGRAVSVA